MTQDEIIEMARDSGMDLYGLGKDRYRFVHHLVAFAKLVAAKERGACAELCDSEKKWWNGMSHAEKDIYQAIDNISALIRARGESK